MSDQEFNAINRLTSKKLAQPRNTSLVQMAVQPLSIDDLNTSVSSNSINGTPDSIKLQDLAPNIDISAGMLRIETQINSAIQSLCTKKKISRDTFVEAAWIILSENPSVLKEVITIAQERYKKRKARGNAKRAESMEKYKNLDL